MRGANLKRFIVVRQLDGTEQQFTEKELPLTIGSGPDNHIIMPGSDSVGAYIEDAQGHLFLQAAKHNTRPLFHNDRHLIESIWLKSNDQLRYGSCVLDYERSGDCIEFSVSKAPEKSEAPVLSPPHTPPSGETANNHVNGAIPVDISKAKISSRRKKIITGTVALSFLLLGCAVLFVLFARPLELTITPAPESISFSGFPPHVRMGSRYLMFPGTYLVTVNKSGYKTYQKEFIINRTSDNHFLVNLEKLPGILNLMVTPAEGVQVFSGSELLGTTPPNKLNLAPGKHQLTLTRDRYQPHKTDVFIEGQQIEQNLEAELQPDWADITIRSDPAGAEVFVNGRGVGFAPVTLQLLSGDQAIALKQDLYSDSAETITVQAGVAGAFNYKLKPLPGQLSLASIPIGAVVSINSEYKGTTPLDITLPSGMVQELKLSHSGYKTLSHSISLAPGEEKNTQLILEQQLGTVFLTTTPTNATVTINGKPYRNVQGELTLPAIAQKVVVSAPGYTSVNRTVTPTPGFSQQLAIDLELVSNTVVPESGKSRQKAPVQTFSGRKLIYIEPAPFTMGAPRREPGRRANERERTVIMEKPFLIGEKLVTNDQYKKFNGQHNSGSSGGHSLDEDSQPVVNITWDQAVAYLNWLSAQDNLEPFYIKQGSQFIAASPPTNGYRLPTEAEWAFSARRAGYPERQRYPWAGGFPPRSIVANFADESASTILPRVIRGYNDTFPVTSPVGSFPPNKGGLYDVGGNASEWCHDYYSAYTNNLSTSVDPLGPSTGTHKVIRGSNWRDGSVTEIRLSYRAYHKEARNNVGFRIARYP